MSGIGRRRRQREPVGRRDRPRRAARRPRRRRRAVRHLDEGRRHRRPRLGRPHERVHGAARPPRRLRRRGRRARRLDLRGAPLRPRRGRRASAPTASRRSCASEHVAELRDAARARRASTTSTRRRSGATARRGSSTTSRSTTRARTDGPTPGAGLRESYLFDRNVIAEIQRAAREGIYDIRGFGAKRRLPHFDDLLLLGASISRYPLEGYRERCDTDVVLGTRFAKKPLELKIPITIAGMSFGALSAPAKEALGRGATEVGTSTTTGDGGMTPEEREHSKTLVYQLLPSRYGMNPDDLRRADAIEVVVGQGAKPGGGGMLLGHKISDRVAEMRDLPKGIDQRSASRHPGLDGPGRPRDQDPRAARDHRLGEAGLRQGRRDAHVLRRPARGQGRRRRDRRRRHAGRHGGDAGRLHRARRHPDAAGRAARGRRAAGARHAPAGAADRLGRDPERRRRREGARARRRRGLDRHGGADRDGRQQPRARRGRTASSAAPRASTTTGRRAATRPASRPRTTSSPRASTRSSAGGELANYLRVLTLETQTLARACGKSHVHNLEPEDLVALTVEAAAMARVPLAGHELDPRRQRLVLKPSSAEIAAACSSSAGAPCARLRGRSAGSGPARRRSRRARRGADQTGAAIAFSSGSRSS